VCATATAQVLVEVEGPIDNFEANGPGSDRILTVMGIPVIITGQTFLYSPTADRRSADDPVGIATNNGNYNLGQWYKGLKFPGRSERGFIGGTAIVLGTFDPNYEIVGDPEGRIGAIIPDEVFSEPAENVVLGLITDSQCSGDSCDAADIAADGITVDLYRDWVQGNAGPYMVPVFDPRMPAGPLVDELGFELDLDPGDSLTGFEFGVEGYYGDTTTPIDLDGNGSLDAGEEVRPFITSTWNWLVPMVRFSPIPARKSAPCASIAVMVTSWKSAVACTRLSTRPVTQRMVVPSRAPA